MMPNEIHQYKLTTMVDEPLDLQDHLPFRLAVVSNLLMLDRDCSFKNTHGLGARELRVIVNIGSYMPVTSADVAYQSKLDTYTVSRAAKVLTEKRLITSQTLGNNKRNKYLVLTPMGYNVYLDLTAKMSERESELTSGISSEDLTELTEVLKKLERKTEALLANNALVQLAREGQISAEQKELIRWHKKTKSNIHSS